MTRTLLVLLLLVQCCSAPLHTGAAGGSGGGGPAIITKVNTQQANASSGTSLSSSGASVSAGNALVVGCVASSGGGVTTTVSDTAANTFNSVGSQLAWNSGGSFAQMFVALNTTANSNDVITCNFSASVNYPGLVAVQYSGVMASNAIDVTNATGTCTGCNSVTSGSFTTVQATEVIIALCEANAGVTFTAGTGFTVETQAGGTGASGFALGDEITSTVQSAATASASWSGSSVPGAILVGSLK